MSAELASLAKGSYNMNVVQKLKAQRVTNTPMPTTYSFESLQAAMYERDFAEGAEAIKELSLAVENFKNKIVSAEKLRDAPPNFEHWKKQAFYPKQIEQVQNLFQKVDLEKTPLPDISIVDKYLAGIEGVEDFFNNDGLVQFQGILDEKNEIDTEIDRMDLLIKAYENPNFTVDQALEYFPGMREEIEDEIVNSDNAWNWEYEDEMDEEDEDGVVTKPRKLKAEEHHH